MTPIQACEETKELWTKMAAFAAEEHKMVWKSDILGPWEIYANKCPCCERAHGDCYFCPMLLEWFRYTDKMNAPCEGPRSPYRMWSNLDYSEGILCIDVEFFCLLIAEMADEAIMRLTAKSQPYLVEDKDIEYV